MKHQKKILLGACFLLILSCTDTDVSSPSTAEKYVDSEVPLSEGLPWGRKSGDKSAVSLPINIISHSYLASSLNSNLLNSKTNFWNNPIGYTRYIGSRQYINLGEIIGNPIFAYPSLTNLVRPPTAPANFPYDSERTLIVKQLNQTTTSPRFRSLILSSFDEMRNIDAYSSYSDFANSIASKLFVIANQQRNQPGGILTSFEQFALSQFYYNVLYVTKSTYNANAGSSCLPQSREDWRKVAEQAFYGGLRLGFSWGISLGIAAAEFGPAGVLVGFLYGFAGGSIIGAYLGAVSKILWNCTFNRLFSPLQASNCRQNDMWGNFTNEPLPGCFSTYVPSPLMSTPFVPNQGATSINSGVMTDISWIRSHM